LLQVVRTHAVVDVSRTTHLLIISVRNTRTEAVVLAKILQKNIQQRTSTTNSAVIIPNLCTRFMCTQKFVYSFVHEKIFIQNRVQGTGYYTIVSRMKDIRKQLGLSLTEMAALLGIKKSTFAKFEQGHR